MEGDADASYFHYCLHRFRWTPKQYLSLDRYEKALVIASIDKKVQDERRERDRLKK